MVYRVRGSAYWPFWQVQNGRDSVPGSPRRVNPYQAWSVQRQAGEIYYPFVSNSEVMFDPWEQFRRKMVIMANSLAAKTMELLDQGAMLVNLREARDTVSFIALQAKRLLAITKALRRPDVRRIKKWFKKNTKPDGRLKTLSGVPAAWLEWNFVAKPLYGEMNTLINVIDNPFTYCPIEFVERDSVAVEDEPRIFGKVSYRADIILSLRGKARIDNINAGLISRLGFDNLVGAAWELTPWSWAIDYFSNAGQWLSSLTSRYDKVVYEDLCYTTSCKGGYGKVTMWNLSPPSNFWSAVWSSTNRVCPDRPPKVEFVISEHFGVRQISYLMSAIGLTVKGKFNGRM